MDISWLLLLQHFREATGGIFDSFFEAVTRLGETSVSSPYLLLALGLVYWCYDKRQGIFMMMSLYTNRVVNGFVKITACVYRPWIRDARVVPVPEAMAEATGYSFPSGHAGNAATVWGGLAVGETYNGKKTPLWARIFFVVVVILVAFSRNYLGVHTPQDVIVALLIAAIVLFAVNKVMKLMDKRPEADVWVLLGGIVLCLLLIAYGVLKPLSTYPMDYDQAGKLIVDPAKMSVDSFKNAGMGLGFFIGWFIERRFIRFSTDIGNTEKIVRYLFCAFTFILVNILVGDMLSKTLISAGLAEGFAKALTQFVCVFWFVAGAPFVSKIFSGLSRKKAEK